MDRIFISYYLMFIKSKDKTPIFAAVSVLTLVFVGFFFLMVLFLKKRYAVDLTGVRGFGIYYVAGHLLLMAFLFWYYKRKDIVNMRFVFEESKINYKIFWKILSMVILLLPFIIIIVVLI